MSARYDVPDLSLFFDQGVAEGATHMFVLYQVTGKTNNRIDRNDRHYYVYPGQDAEKVIEETAGRFPGAEIMEVYKLSLSKSDQLNERYAMHL